VNAQDRCRATPLYLASENGHVMVVKLLVEHNAQLDIRAVSM
jgi:ankyrin repeat protein